MRTASCAFCVVLGRNGAGSGAFPGDFVSNSDGKRRISPGNGASCVRDHFRGVTYLIGQPMATPGGWPSPPMQGTQEPNGRRTRETSRGGQALALHRPPRSGPGKGAQRRHQTARATGAAGAHGTRQGPKRQPGAEEAGGQSGRPRSAAEAETNPHPRAGARSPPHAGPQAPPAKPGRDRRDGRRSAQGAHKRPKNQTRAGPREGPAGGRRRRGEDATGRTGGRPRERRRTSTPAGRETAAGADPKEAAAERGRRSRRRAPAGRDQAAQRDGPRSQCGPAR